MPDISVLPSTSASNSPPGTGISSTWSGCSCSSASMSGATAPKPWRTARIEIRILCYEGAAAGPPFGFSGKRMTGTTVTLAQSVLRGLACKCPRCGNGKLYAGFLELRPACEQCGLDYAFIDAGD